MMKFGYLKSGGQGRRRSLAMLFFVGGIECAGKYKIHSLWSDVGYCSARTGFEFDEPAISSLG